MWQGQCPGRHRSGSRVCKPFCSHGGPGLPGPQSGRCSKKASQKTPQLLIGRVSLCVDSHSRHPSGFYSSLEHTVVIVASDCQGQVKAPRAVGHLRRARVFQVDRSLQKTHAHPPSPWPPQFCWSLFLFSGKAQRPQRCNTKSPHLVPGYTSTCGLSKGT